MKPNKTVTHSISLPNPTTSNAQKSTDKATDSDPNLVELKAVPANGHTETEPLYDDVCVQSSTVTAAKKCGMDEDFVHMIKKICSLALGGFKRGDKVDSTMLCAEIRYGRRKDAFVGDSNVSGLDIGERLDAGTVVLILADAGELPLELLGPNKANLQKYRVK